MSDAQRLWTNWAWLGIAIGVAIVILQARFLGAAIFDLAFRLPPDPVALLGDVLVIGSSLVLVCLRLKFCH